MTNEFLCFIEMFSFILLSAPWSSSLCSVPFETSSATLLQNSTNGKQSLGPAHAQQNISSVLLQFRLQGLLQFSTKGHLISWKYFHVGGSI